jgi:hypothetical protein
MYGMMYSNKIEIDGTRANEDQQWRIYRIHRIIGYAQALADLDINEDFFKKIVGIYDDKGTLYISWHTEPTNNEKEYLQKAWESVVTDYEGNPIEHEILSQEI